MSDGTPDLAGLRDLALDTAREAGEFLLAGHARALATVATKTTSTDMVSEIDHASEELIRARLLGARPYDGFLGEESGEHEGVSGVRWVVDPLDGTTNYLYGIPGYNVSIAAQHHGRTVAAAVVSPLERDEFTATLGGGAQRNGATITCATTDRMAQALVITGFSYDPARRRLQAQALAEVIGRVRDVRRFGAAAIDLCSVACGRADAYYERGLAPWDLAAGSLIASEAGARVADEDDLGFVLAAPPALFGDLAALLTEAGVAAA